MTPVERACLRGVLATSRSLDALYRRDEVARADAQTSVHDSRAALAILLADGDLSRVDARLGYLVAP